MKTNVLASYIQWAARILGTLLVLITAIISIGVLIDSWNKPGPGLATYNIVLFSVMGIGMLSLLYALKDELLGGLLSLICFIVVNGLAYYSPVEGAGYVLILLLLLLPPILYIIHARMKNTH